jgi:hypothetical protein
MNTQTQPQQSAPHGGLGQILGETFVWMTSPIWGPVKMVVNGMGVPPMPLSEAEKKYNQGSGTDTQPPVTG